MNFFRAKPEFRTNAARYGFAVERVNRFTGILTVRTSRFGYFTGYRRMSWAEWDEMWAKEQRK